METESVSQKRQLYTPYIYICTYIYMYMYKDMYVHIQIKKNTHKGKKRLYASFASHQPHRLQVLEPAFPRVDMSG